MNILVVSNCPLAYNQGSGYVILNVIKGLRNAGHAVKSYEPKDYEPFKKFPKASTYKIALGMLLLFFLRIKPGDFNIIAFYGAESWLTLFFYKKLFRSKVLMICNSNGLETNYLDTMMNSFGTISYNQQSSKWNVTDPRKFYHKAFFWCDGIITNNESDRLYAIARGYQLPSQIVTVALGLDAEFLNQSVNFTNTKTIGFCGSWIQRKGVKYLIDSLNKLLIHHADYKAVLIGVGSIDKHEYFIDNVCDRITIYDQIYDKMELLKVYHMVSIFVMPSQYESFGLVLAEAMACGCAAIATDTGYASSLSELDIIKIETINSTSLTKAIERLILDENLRQSIARSGFKRSQQLQWGISIKKIEETYNFWLTKYASHE